MLASSITLEPVTGTEPKTSYCKKSKPQLDPEAVCVFEEKYTEDDEIEVEVREEEVEEKDDDNDEQVGKRGLPGPTLVLINRSGSLMCEGKEGELGEKVVTASCGRRCR